MTLHRNDFGGLLQEKRYLRLHIGAVKNRLVIDFSGSGKKKKFPVKAVQNQLERYNGILKQERKSDEFRVWITLDE